MVGLSSVDTALARMHRLMLNQLSELGRLGEHIAAVHLAAAIDALEDRLDVPTAERAERRANDPIDALAKDLILQLGHRAPAAVREQMTGAMGETLLSWAAVASRIDALQKA